MSDFLPVFKRNIRFNHNSKLPEVFRMIIVGEPGTGKNVLFTKMLLTENFFDINKMYYFSNTLKKQCEMNKIINAFNQNLHKDDIMHLFKLGVNEEEFQYYVDELSKQLTQKKQIHIIASSKINDFPTIDDVNNDMKNLLVLDDFQNNKKVTAYAEENFCNNRKYNCCNIYIGQRFMKVPKEVRSTANFIIGFSQQKDDGEWFYNNVLSRYIDKEDFNRLIEKEWKINPETGHSGYIAVNRQTGEIYTNLFS